MRDRGCRWSPFGSRLRRTDRAAVMTRAPPARNVTASCGRCLLRHFRVNRTQPFKDRLIALASDPDTLRAPVSHNAPLPRDFETKVRSARAILVERHGKDQLWVPHDRIARAFPDWPLIERSDEVKRLLQVGQDSRKDYISGIFCPVTNCSDRGNGALTGLTSFPPDRRKPGVLRQRNSGGPLVAHHKIRSASGPRTRVPARRFGMIRYLLGARRGGASEPRFQSFGVSTYDRESAC